ncbi:MAG: sugar ABC transporter permease [Microbacteriaceae bacterium]|nr:sugar ABC transporter permease [Microbacteriaceae bacterium]
MIDSIGENLVILVIGMLVFVGVILLIFLLAERTSVRSQEVLRYAVFLGPALLLLAIGLLYPAGRTIYLSFMNKQGQEFVGLDNYIWAFTTPEIQIVIRNTFIWVLVVPIFATIFGLAMAYLTDRMKFASVVKSLVFLPMAISMVGASIIWRFVYTYRPDDEQTEIGLLSAIVEAFGGEPLNWLLTAPLNTFLLIAVMVWIQTGFSMVVLSAAMKAIPDDIQEAAMLDGAGQFKRFLQVTVPMIRASIVVVVTTTLIGTLKVFDIVRTMTGGNFSTSVVANEMYTQAFRQLNYGTGSTLAVLLLIAIIPLIWYNIRQLRLERTER